MKNPKKFWRVIKDLTNPITDLTKTARFIDPTTQEYVEIGSEANFLNNYFLNIVGNLDIPMSDKSMLDVYNVDTHFCFINDLPTEPEIIKIIKEIDINKSSCIEGINSKMCKDAMLAVPSKICHMMVTSLCKGEIPSAWTKGIISVLPKGGDLLNPSNWRPITQTSIFVRLSH